MNTKQDITIRLADLPPMALSVRREDEEVARRAASEVNRLWESWSTRFKDRSSAEVMGMVAYRFAHLLLEQMDAAGGLDDDLKALDDALGDCLDATE